LGSSSKSGAAWSREWPMHLVLKPVEWLNVAPRPHRTRERGRFTSHGRGAPETAEAPETQIELRPPSPTGGCGAPTPGWLRRPGHRESCVHLHHRQAAATLPQAGWGAQV
jgi:hypothetical protein